jgi:hypothetical protein
VLSQQYHLQRQSIVKRDLVLPSDFLITKHGFGDYFSSRGRTHVVISFRYCGSGCTNHRRDNQPGGQEHHESKYCEYSFLAMCLTRNTRCPPWKWVDQKHGRRESFVPADAEDKQLLASAEIAVVTSVDSVSNPVNSMAICNQT